MTFAINKDLTTSKKIIIFEIDIPYDFTTLINTEAGIWETTLTPEYILTITEGVISLEENPDFDDTIDIQSVIVNGTYYTLKTSLINMRDDTNGECFYYDSDTTKLYIKFTDVHKPVGDYYLDYITAGNVTGFVDASNSLNGCYYKDKYYEPRLKSIPSLSKKKDPLFFGLLAYQGGSISLINNDGYFDNYQSTGLFRQPCRVKLGFDGDTIDDFRTVWSGFVDTYSYGWDTFTIKAIDPRKKLSKTIPENVFTLDDYPDLNPSDVGKVKPLAWGDIIKAPLICINDADEEAEDYLFYIADTEYNNLVSIDHVYLDNKELTVTTEYTASTTTGLITIPAEICSGARGDVSASFTGSSFKYPTSILLDCLQNYADLPFLNDNLFNQTDINLVTVEADTESVEMYLYLTEATPISKVIETCCINQNILFFAQDDGKWTARFYDPDREVDRTIQDDEWIDNPSVDIDETRYLSSATIKYAKDLANDIYSRYDNTDYEVATVKLYKTPQSKEFETTLSSETGAIYLSEKIMFLSKEIKRIVTRSTKIQNIDLELMDFVTCDPFKRQSVEADPVDWEVIGINKNLNDLSVFLTLREI